MLSFFELLLNKYSQNKLDNSRKLIECIFTNPYIVDDFLALCDQRCLQEEGKDFLIKSIIDSCLHDQTGDYLVKFLQCAFKPNYSFIKEAWPEIIDQLNKQDLYNQNKDKFFRIYHNIFSYIKENQPIDDESKIECLIYALFNLFPKVFIPINEGAHSNKLASLINCSLNNFESAQSSVEYDPKDYVLVTKFCDAWLCLRQFKVPHFPGVKALTDMLILILKNNECTIGTYMMALLITSTSQMRNVLFKNYTETFSNEAAAWFFYSLNLKEQLNDNRTHTRTLFVYDLISCLKKTLELDPNYGSTIIKMIVETKEPLLEYFDPRLEHEDVILLSIFQKDTIKNPKALSLLAKIFWDKRDFMEAIYYFSKLKEIDPYNSTNILMYAKCLADFNKYQESYDLLFNTTDYFANKNDLILAYYLQSSMLCQLSNYPAALNTINIAVELSLQYCDKNQMDLLLDKRGDIHFKLKNFQEALKDFKTNANDGFRALSQIRDCHIELKQEKEAYEVFETCENSHEFVYLYGNLQTCLILQNKEKTQQVIDQISAMTIDKDFINFLKMMRANYSNNQAAILILEKLQMEGLID